MDMHELQQFNPVTPEKFDKIRADIKAKTGLDINTDEGQAEARGITIRWKYDRAKQDLEVQMLKRSFFDPSEVTIDQDIHNEVEGILFEK